MIRSSFVILFMVWAVYGNRETHRLVKVYDGKDVVQDIVHDKDKGIVTVTVSQTPGLAKQVPTVSFHDFKTKMVAFKDIEHGVCLLTYAPIPFATPDIYKLGRTFLELPYTAKVQRQQMPKEEINAIAGINIADFCAEYRTFWMDLTPKRNDKVIKRTEDEPEPCLFFCTLCVVEADKDYQTPQEASVVMG